jgi:hypothetical protein
MTEVELFAAHGMPQPSRAQLDAIWWAQLVHNPLAADEEASDDGVALESRQPNTEAA